MTVNTLRKQCPNDEVILLAKALIKSWKKLLPGNAFHRCNLFLAGEVYDGVVTTN